MSHWWIRGLALLLCNAAGALDPVSIEGTWLSGDGSGWIAIELTGAGPIGRIAGSPDDPDNERAPRKDERNPEPGLRNRPLLGLAIMQGFEADGDGRWKGGTIYNPNNGKTYRCKLKLVDANTLQVRGYLGVSLLGRTETWTRSDVIVNFN